MTMARSRYVNDGEEGFYHCFNRCVRRAYLCGFDRLTGRDYSHRKGWFVERLKFLAAYYAIQVCSYSVLDDHFHMTVRTRPDLVATWSDREVAIRWLKVSRRYQGLRGNRKAIPEKEIRALIQCPKRIAELRRNMSSLSWFMAMLEEYIARRANKEDGVTGRFWESRFRSQALLDPPAILACMVYVDLNIVRAGLAKTPEESDFTSIRERILAWKEQMMKEDYVAGGGEPEEGNEAFNADMLLAIEAPVSSSAAIEIRAGISEVSEGSASWLCPISSDSRRGGILEMTEAEYFDLVDRSGRMIRSDKRGAIDPDLAPILLRIGARPEAWMDTVSRFESKFGIAVGLVSNLRLFADRIGSRWLKGIAGARGAFVESPLQSAGTYPPA